MKSEQEIEVQACPSCGISYGAPASFFSERRKDGKTFFCPNGHRLSWEETEADKLRRERDRLAQRIGERDDRIATIEGERDHFRAQAAGYKGVAAKIRYRVARGVCPCCSRTFSNLASHIASKHPSYPDQGAGGLAD